MELHINIKMDNAAFEEEPGIEAARILNKLAATIQADNDIDEKIFDINGNSIGRAWVELDD